ncbi:RNB domain-containing ribonuclease [Marichromatium bheemlicum]|uniref:RNB domain-containing ribonuclease n=1 Tax=Marichromatium bheemlicum TaxID=365339 RepID=A0ABX1I4Q0_9GAMM|nr:RNB domain-containing ribonuclease [Marichromatium bheemlicum]NKN32527.1 RNB domain-containing ribonuclease [Marichromatium bheemlicum]
MSRYQATPPVDSLVLYKTHPARVLGVGDKIEIQLDGGSTKRVRPKDIVLLHPGPLRSLGELTVAPEGAVDEAWELLEGEVTTLADLAELAFAEFTPASAWASWLLVAEGLRFRGTPERIEVQARAEVERERAEREAKAAAERDWKAFLERMRAAAPAPEDRPRLAEVERLALAQTERSRILEALGYPQTPEHAHRALVEVAYWPPNHNPHPARRGVSTKDAALAVPALDEDEPRLDLTHLEAFAIDDEGNEDPDDALSLEGDRIWVHIADVAALVGPDSPLDLEARTRGANLYLPERMVKMLPGETTTRLGLGLQPVSPALSFGFRCDAQGELYDIEVARSWVRVQRLTYGEVEGRLDQPPFDALRAAIGRFHARRQANGATRLALPEVNVRVEEGRVVIRPLPRLESRELVTDAMLMAGEAAARVCLEQNLAIPFATQVPPDPAEEATDLASMYARRRCFKPTRLLCEPDLHAGLGLALYTRATSPLRRYSDLLVHQQLRAWLTGARPLDREQVTERTAQAELGAVAARRGERLSNQHWKLVYLRDNPGWRGEGVVVAVEERKVVVLVPELALEARVRTRERPALNDTLRLAVANIDLPELSASFRVLG